MPKQPTQDEEFGSTLAAPENTPIATLNATQRPTVIQKEAQNITRRNKKNSKILRTANPFTRSSPDDEHNQLLGF
jgi:hypothetical protein